MLALILLAATQARGEVVISSKPTQNMSCSAGTCAATARKAVMNAADLEAMLAGGDVRIASGSAAKDIEIRTPVSWATSSRLTLDAWHGVAFRQRMTISGDGALTITTSDGGSFGDYVFIGKGRVEFLGDGGNLIINGNLYALAYNIKGFSKIANSDYRFVALKHSIDAGHKIYSTSPVPFYDGVVEGLGNTISNLKINDTTGVSYVALFGQVSTIGLPRAQIRDIGLISVDIEASGGNQEVGALVGMYLGAPLLNSWSTGHVSAAGQNSAVGGLVGIDQADVLLSHSKAMVSGSSGVVYVGGLIGYAVGQCVGACLAIVDRCYAEGGVSGSDGSEVGGLIGYDIGAPVSNSYATGAVSAGQSGFSGGLIGTNSPNGTLSSPLSVSYATGAVSGGAGSALGGLVGQDLTTGDISATYWDIDTSGIADPSRGAGNVANDPGITGLTTAQFQSGLPPVFDPSVWAEAPAINGGLPYLRDLPPG